MRVRYVQENVKAIETKLGRTVVCRNLINLTLSLRKREDISEFTKSFSMSYSVNNRAWLTTPPNNANRADLHERINELSRRTNYFVPGGGFLVPGALHSRNCAFPSFPDSFSRETLQYSRCETTRRKAEGQERGFLLGSLQHRAILQIKLLRRHKFNESRREAAPRCR